MNVTVKKHRDGSFSFWYPEPGWVYCPCKTHVGQEEPPLVESPFRMRHEVETLEHAARLAGKDGVVNIVEVKT